MNDVLVLVLVVVVLLYNGVVVVLYKVDDYLPDLRLKM